MAERIPTRPLLAPWYRLVEDGDRLLLEHGQSVVILEGAAVRAFVPALLPLLDGSRDVEEIAGALGVVARPAVDLALETLAANGLLVQGPQAHAEVPATVSMLAAAYRVAPAEAARRTSEAAVGIIGNAPYGEAIERLLRAAGVGDVTRLAGLEPGSVQLAIAVPAVDELALLGSWNTSALASGRPWLPVRPFDGRIAMVGPLILPGRSCCHTCLQLRRASNLTYGADLKRVESAAIAAHSGAVVDALIGAVAAHTALCWLVGDDPLLPGVLQAIESSPSLSITAHPVLRVPRCPSCSRVTASAAPLPWHEAHVA